MAIIISTRCSGCGACLSACPFGALTLTTDQPRGRGKKRAVVDHALCCSCGGCIDQCPLCAMTISLK
ncbi:MAG: 4Fe-4S binding protein [Desulfuromonadales bacterium]|nr:4Fe-4S binding protein [Desulfuromonadales bacterium]